MGTRRQLVIEVVVCAALVALLSLNALRRMDYLNADTAHHIRMTDATRSAYVGKRIADGDGYKTADLPASLIDFYDQRGKLHDADWVNADRFPFTAYAVAALYTVTRSTGYEIGILVYNLICFVAFLVLLYRLARSLFGEPWTPTLALALALAHPQTYLYLYYKDADMMALTVGMMMLLVAYHRAGSEPPSRRLAIGIGTLLAWLFLARPNLGAPFVIAFAIVGARRWRRDAHSRGERSALRRLAGGEGLALLAAALWLVPFVIHSLAEWGSPLFSANSMYQLPIGTRYDMGTDTWWKYTEPGHPITLGALVDGDRASVIAKFTTSWPAMIRSLVSGFALELALAFGAVWLLRRAGAPDLDRERGRVIGMLAGCLGFVFLMNLAVLPLYGPPNYSYRHYLGIIFPWMWMMAGHCVYAIAGRAKPHVAAALAHVRKNPGLWLAVAVLAVILWNYTSKVAGDTNRLFPKTAAFLGKHWLATLLVLLAIALRRWVLRLPRSVLPVAIAFTFVYACYRPNTGIKHLNLIWFPADEAVWSELAKRDGIVSSLALQGEVAWNTGRKNIPAPEWPMHLYSFKYDHDLEIQDLYIESAAAQLSITDGQMTSWAPGFEGYQRLQQYREHLPGYALAFHDEDVIGYSKFRIKPRLKASTVYKLVDRDAAAALAHSPDQIAVGDPRNVIFTAHGWGGYYEIDGKRVAAATDVTRRRYRRGPSPWEDTGITFFVDDRRPTQAVFEFYAPAPATYTFYWNLDLYAYDHPADRDGHRVGSVTADAPGWQRTTLTIPVPLIRKGLNKLGFRSSTFQPVVICASKLSEAACQEPAPAEPPSEAEALEAPGLVTDPPATVMRSPGHTGVSRERVSLFASSLEFGYSPP